MFVHGEPAAGGVSREDDGLALVVGYRLAADGTIPGFKVGGSWRFRKAVIEDWIDQQTVKNRT